jgi:hypothetical protein
MELETTINDHWECPTSISMRVPLFFPPKIALAAAADSTTSYLKYTDHSSVQQQAPQGRALLLNRDTYSNGRCVYLYMHTLSAYSIHMCTYI